MREKIRNREKEDIKSTFMRLIARIKNSYKVKNNKDELRGAHRLVECVYQAAGPEFTPKPRSLNPQQHTSTADCVPWKSWSTDCRVSPKIIFSTSQERITNKLVKWYSTSLVITEIKLKPIYKQYSILCYIDTKMNQIQKKILTF